MNYYVDNIHMIIQIFNNPGQILGPVVAIADVSSVSSEASGPTAY